MNTLSEILKSVTKQQQQINSFVGLNSFQNIAESIRQSQKPMHLAGLGGISDIAKSLAQQMEPINKANAFITGNLGIQAALAIQSQTDINKFALGGLSSSLANIFKYNQGLSNQIAGIASSQISLSSNLTQIAKSIDNSHLNKFNSLSVAIQGISSSYLREFVKNKEWDDLEIVEEVNDTISSISETLVAKSDSVTGQDLQDLRLSIITDLSDLLAKSKTERVKLFLLELITIIGFILTLYGNYQSSTGKTNQDVIDSTKSEIEKVKKEIFDKIDYEFKKNHKTRISTTNVRLRYSNNKRSQILGLVKEGQKVTVIEIRHKWILASYLDFETGEPKSGFVYKKYFKQKK
jgi:hypothetical protein